MKNVNKRKKEASTRMSAQAVHWTTAWKSQSHQSDEEWILV